MDTFPVVLSFAEARKYTASLKGVLRNLKFYSYNIKVYDEIFRHKSLNEVNEFLYVYNLQNRLDEISVEKDDAKIRSGLSDLKVNKIYLKTKYAKFHNKISLLQAAFRQHLKTLNFYKLIVNDSFNLVFTTIDLEKALSKITNNSEKLEWIKELSNRIYFIYTNFSDKQIDLLFAHYKLNALFPVSKLQENAKVNSHNLGKYDNFKRFLVQTFLFRLSNLEYNLEIDIKVNQILSYPSLENVSEKDKFFLWGFKFDTMRKFSDRAFLIPEQKIEYFSYAYSQFHIHHPDISEDKYMSRELKKIETLLNHLKTTYDLKKNLSSNNVPKEPEPHNNSMKKISVSECSNILVGDKLIWLAKRSILIHLLNLLQQYGFLFNRLDVDPRCVRYSSIFSIKSEPDNSKVNAKPVKWEKHVSDLAYLINELVGRNLISKSKHWKRTENVFLNNDGLPLSSDSLRTTSSKLYSSRFSKDLRAILNEIDS